MKYSIITALSVILLKDLNNPILHMLFTSEAYHTGLPKFGTLTIIVVVYNSLET